MQALVLKNSNLSLQNIDMPIPTDGECLIKVTRAGICNTDIELLLGYMGFTGTPGHEFCGIIEQAHTPELIGSRVVGEINLGCGSCNFCLSGNKEHCPNRSVLGILNKQGAFAEYLTLPEQNIHVLPDCIRDDEAIFIEPLAAALRISQQVMFDAEKRIAILGDGKLGLLIAEVLAQYPALDVTLFGHHKEKLDLLADNSIQTTTTYHAEDHAVAFDYIIDATGSISGFEQALAMLKPQGTLILKSTVAGGKQFNFAPIVINEITVIGSRCGPFRPAIRMLADKKIDVKKYITASYDLSEWNNAFKHAQSSEAIKIVLKTH